MARRQDQGRVRLGEGRRRERRPLREGQGRRGVGLAQGQGPRGGRLRSRPRGAGNRRSLQRGGSARTPLRETSAAEGRRGSQGRRLDRRLPGDRRPGRSADERRPAARRHRERCDDLHQRHRQHARQPRDVGPTAGEGDQEAGRRRLQRERCPIGRRGQKEGEDRGHIYSRLPGRHRPIGRRHDLGGQRQPRDHDDDGPHRALWRPQEAPEGQPQCRRPLSRKHYSQQGSLAGLEGPRHLEGRRNDLRERDLLLPQRGELPPLRIRRRRGGEQAGDKFRGGKVSSTTPGWARPSRSTPPKASPGATTPRWTTRRPTPRSFTRAGAASVRTG